MAKKLVKFNVKGTSFNGRQAILEQILEGKNVAKCIAILVPEPDNPFDKNAIKVCVLDMENELQQIGYVPKEICEEFLLAIKTKIVAKKHKVSIFRSQEKDGEFLYAEFEVLRRNKK